MSAPPPTIDPAGPARQRNRRGEGRRLRSDIIQAASGLLEETGTQESVTLRAVARRVGIAAPSIYPHFADRHAMIVAVKEQIFRSLILALESANRDADPGGNDPVDGLWAGCAAYLRFASEHPDLYRTVFGDHGFSDLDCSWPAGHGPVDGDATLASGVAAFDVLVVGVRRCIDAGRSTSTDPFNDAVALWVALHGLATLLPGSPNFPWPDLDELLTRLVNQLARITPRA